MTYPIHDAVAKVDPGANPNIRHALDLIADKIEPVTPPPPAPSFPRQGISLPLGNFGSNQDFVLDQAARW